MARTSRKDVERVFQIAFTGLTAEDFGRGGTNEHNIGRYALDYAGCYGGWVVICFSGGDSGAGYCHGPTPWGTRRRASREMLSFLADIAYGRMI